MKLIDLHKEWCEKNEIKDRINAYGCGGLCNAIPKKYSNNLEAFRPYKHKTYWGQRNGSDTSFKQVYGYNPLRQTIVLLICAMNNEL